MFASGNNTDQIYANVKYLGDMSVADACCAHSADQQDVIVTEFGLERRRSKSAELLSMPRVFSMSAPFEIGEDVIGSHRIDMVDNREVVGIRDERCGYKAMDAEWRAFTFFAKKKARISIFVDLMTENLPSPALGMSVFVNDDTCDAAHSAKSAYLVQPFITNDGLPFFCESDIHTAGYLSGQVGLMIKNPPRASTFGGFAVMAATSDICNTLQ